MDNFTNREFNSLTNEVMRVAREITEKSNYICSINIGKNYTLLTIQLNDNNKTVATMLYFYKERFCSTKEFKRLLNVITYLPHVRFGKYLNMISQSYQNCNKGENYFEF